MSCLICRLTRKRTLVSTAGLLSSLWAKVPTVAVGNWRLIKRVAGRLTAEGQTGLDYGYLWFSEVPMVRFNQQQSWTSNPHDLYIPVAYDGEVVGYLKPKHVEQILDALNDSEKVRKALKLACYDLVARSGGSKEKVSDLVQKYLTRAGRPTRGVAAIALFLRERQLELDLTDDEFKKFCDTFRLSAAELEGIYQGNELDSAQLTPLARILGMSVDELIQVWKGGA